MKGLPGILVVIILAATLPAVAQTEPDARVTVAVLQVEKQAIVENTMELSETQAEAFWPLYLEYDKASRAISDRMVKLIDRYLSQYDQLTNAHAETVLAEYLAIEQDRLKLKQKYIKKFRKVLTARMTARFFQLENKLEAMTRAELATEIPLVR